METLLRYRREALDSTDSVRTPLLGDALSEEQGMQPGAGAGSGPHLQWFRAKASGRCRGREQGAGEQVCRVTLKR